MSTPSAPTIIPGTSGERTGAAVHKDLYRLDAGDPQAERARLRGEARKLGIAFFVFFGLIIGGLSLLLNGAHRRGHVIEVTAPAGTPVEDVTLAGAAAWTARWSGGRTSPVAHVDLEAPTDDDATPDVQRAGARVRVKVIDADGRRHDAATLYVAPVEGARLLGVEVRGAGATPAVRSFPYALRTARLARVIPTHCVMALGALLGLLGALVPALLVPFYRFWMGYVAAPLGWFNTRLILGLVFFLMFTPMALVLAVQRAMKPEGDPLARRPRPGQSYWRTRAQPRPRQHFERTF